MGLELPETLLKCQSRAEILKLAKFDCLLEVPVDEVEGEEAAFKCHLLKKTNLMKSFSTKALSFHLLCFQTFSS